MQSTLACRLGSERVHRGNADVPATKYFKWRWLTTLTGRREKHEVTLDIAKIRLKRISGRFLSTVKFKVPCGGTGEFISRAIAHQMNRGFAALYWRGKRRFLHKDGAWRKTDLNSRNPLGELESDAFVCHREERT